MALTLKPIEKEELPRQETSSKKNLNKIPAYGIFIISALLIIYVALIQIFRLFPSLNFIQSDISQDLFGKIAGTILALSGILLFCFSIWVAIILLRKKNAINKIPAYIIFIAIILTFALGGNNYITAAIFIFSIWTSIIILRKENGEKLPLFKKISKKFYIIAGVISFIIILVILLSNQLVEKTRIGTEGTEPIEGPLESKQNSQAEQKCSVAADEYMKKYKLGKEELVGQPYESSDYKYHFDPIQERCFLLISTYYTPSTTFNIKFTLDLYDLYIHTQIGTFKEYDDGHNFCNIAAQDCANRNEYESLVAQYME